MSDITTYDKMRDKLRYELNECLKLAKELVVGDDVWGYSDMPEDYAMDVYLAVKKARDAV